MASNGQGMQRTATPTGTRGSLTVTSTPAGPSIPLNVTRGTLRLRAEPVDPDERRHIQWAEDVVDNEGMGKKSSKVCCIYHKPRKAGESSSDESSSSSSDDSDSEPDTSRAQPANRRRKPRRPPHHNHDGEPHNHDGDCGDASPSKSKGKGKARSASPNAYERVPARNEQG